MKYNNTQGLHDINLAKSAEYKESADSIMANVTVGPSNMVDVSDLFKNMATIFLNFETEAERDAYNSACCSLTGRYIEEIATEIIKEHKSNNDNTKKDEVAV